MIAYQNRLHDYCQLRLLDYWQLRLFIVLFLLTVDCTQQRSLTIYGLYRGFDVPYWQPSWMLPPLHEAHAFDPITITTGKLLNE